MTLQVGGVTVSSKALAGKGWQATLDIDKAVATVTLGGSLVLTA